jgi:hypothetical protein
MRSGDDSVRKLIEALFGDDVITPQMLEELKKLGVDVDRVQRYLKRFRDENEARPQVAEAPVVARATKAAVTPVPVSIESAIATIETPKVLRAEPTGGPPVKRRKLSLSEHPFMMGAQTARNSKGSKKK